ncbi:MAG: response regulator [Planctomycetes bacterium]|nr:response regulator [Planctomycetota bacterium]
MRVLIVDDSAIMRKIQRKVLVDMGIEDIVDAEDGIDALMKMKEHNFDFNLVLCDWNMPKMDGITLVRKLRSVSQLAKMPIVMVTTEGEKERVVEALKAGANGYIVKPFKPETITEKLKPFLAA